MNWYIHLSRRPVTKVRDTIQDDKSMHEGRAKPGGLWFTVGENEDERWKNLRLSNGDSPELFEYRTEIIIAADAKILYVHSTSDLDAVTAKYGNHSESEIDWPKIAREYDGIILAPYNSQWSNSARKKWYASWDLASGCIWNKDAISKLVPR